MLEICNNFKIDQSKIVKIVTDNAQNMVKAFTNFNNSDSLQALHYVDTSKNKLSLQLY